MKDKNKINLVLPGLLVLAGAVLACFLLLAKGQGNRVRVLVDGVAVAEFALDEELTYPIAGYNGGSNTLVLAGGKAIVTDADCPDKLCEGMGPVSRVGQSIICLPNRVVVEVRDAKGSAVGP